MNAAAPKNRGTWPEMLALGRSGHAKFVRIKRFFGPNGKISGGGVTICAGAGFACAFAHGGERRASGCSHAPRAQPKRRSQRSGVGGEPAGR